jgi:hypothetical protein
MAYYDKINCDLRARLFTSLIVENHPSFKQGSVLYEAIVGNPTYFNFTHIIEDMMSVCSEGQYKFTNGIHEDYSDSSECKTGTLHLSEASNFSSAELTNVRSQDGTIKNGAIRAVILNPILEKLHFFFIPKKSVHRMMHTMYGEPKSSRSLWLRYNTKSNRFSTVDKYGFVEYNTFKELAMEKNR